ncbi:hypothetical protein [Photobacterium sp. OFAV2-7]|uniref:hypothetical protein n=1 Tax=Photobacterium sp. OFAV2-7 TaxID=2917748 RepID=UPI001EF44E80|nr:hypothetical protein [Photobacterium sp. OFAV2-7]MCG7584332.1 hypothetical protein [Photobacterium sp. OFAV2-7]
MKRVHALLTTAAITGTVWGLTLVQPAVAESNTQSMTQDTRAHTVEAKAQKEEKKYYRQVIARTISLEEVQNLLDEFSQKVMDESTYAPATNEIIVVYETFNADFTAATITMGYADVRNLPPSEQIILPPAEQAVLLLTKGRYSTAQYTDAWHKIDFQKPVRAVVETHTLDEQGEPVSSQMSVYYQ